MIYNQRKEQEKIEQNEEIEAILEFLNELTKLTKKYGIVIDGCGCCGSPYLYHINEALGKYQINEIKFMDGTKQKVELYKSLRFFTDKD